MTMTFKQKRLARKRAQAKEAKARLKAEWENSTVSLVKVRCKAMPDIRPIRPAIKCSSGLSASGSQLRTSTSRIPRGVR
ncbi:hypothetical protein PMPD1_2499 [Paramixta manurensis]|uniref:Uncharacterized protein n=1 Tax=Paramixta manurensis TaxID=2740817 RepID=A0A6M8UET0_9GAMM|nr:hypothetical protein PMPD1_2499 [Erwiniaceae bacterium PD-1]